MQKSVLFSVDFLFLLGIIALKLGNIRSHKMMDKLSREHCWRIISILGVKTLYTYEELNAEIEKHQALKIEILIQKLW